MPDLDDLKLDSRVHWADDILRFRDTDALGHINNATFSILCESGRVGYFARWLTPSLRPGTFFVLVRIEIDFRAELHYPGAVRTGTWLSKLGRSSMSFGQAIVSAERVAADATSICVLMDGSTRRATPFMDETRAIAERLLRPAE